MPAEQLEQQYEAADARGRISCVIDGVPPNGSDAYHKLRHKTDPRVRLNNLAACSLGTFDAMACLDHVGRRSNNKAADEALPRLGQEWAMILESQDSIARPRSTSTAYRCCTPKNFGGWDKARELLQQEFQQEALHAVSDWEARTPRFKLFTADRLRSRPATCRARAGPCDSIQDSIARPRSASTAYRCRTPKNFGGWDKARELLQQEFQQEALHAVSDWEARTPRFKLFTADRLRSRPATCRARVCTTRKVPKHGKRLSILESQKVAVGETVKPASDMRHLTREEPLVYDKEVGGEASEWSQVLANFKQTLQDLST